MKKIKSGIYGLNPLMDGGVNKNSTTVVVGASGAGKTTFATQFIRRGLEEGQEGIFVSLDENKQQIIREAVEMGWAEILDYLDDEKLVFIDASGKDFSKFIKKELPSFVDQWIGADARIVVDPLTPVMWAIDSRYEQRDLIGFLLKETRKVGTVVCTLEEHGSTADLSGNEIVIPMYLADSVIHLQYSLSGGDFNRNLRIIKCRSSRHSQESHPYRIIRGLGLIVEGKNRSKKVTREIPNKLENILNTKRIPTPIKKQFQKVLKDLRDEDFKGLPLEDLIDDIIDEYEGK